MPMMLMMPKMMPWVDHMVRNEPSRFHLTGFFSAATHRFSHTLSVEPSSDGPAYTFHKKMIMAMLR